MPDNLRGAKHRYDSRTFADYVNTYNLNTSATSITIPAGYDYVRINCDGNIGIRVTGTAATGGAGNVTDGTGTEVFPAGSYYFALHGGATISALAQTGSVDASFAFFKGPI